MAKKQQQYEDFTDSIFQFIFKAARQENKNLKPPTPSGATGSEMADALTEIATLPLTYAGEQVLTPFQESLNAYKMSSNKFQVDEHPPLKVEVTAGNFAEFMSDPESFVDAAFAKKDSLKKGAKKLNRIRGLGGALDIGIGALLSYSNGLSGQEAIRAGWLYGNDRYWGPEKRNLEAEKIVAKTSAYEVAESLGLNHSDAENVGSALENALESTRLLRMGVNDRIKRHSFPTDLEYKNKLLEEHKKILEGALSRSGYGGSPIVSPLLDIQLAKEGKYKQFNNLGDKGMWNLGDPGDLDATSSSENPIFGTGTGSYSGQDWIDKWSQSKSPSNKARALEADRLSKEITIIEKDLQSARTAGAPTSTIDSLQKQSDTLQKQFWTLAIFQRSNGTGMKASKMFGEVYIHVTAFNEIVLSPTGGLYNVLSGDFFDHRKNDWSPSIIGEVKIHALKKEARDEVGDLIIDHAGNPVMESQSFADVVIPKGGSRIKKNLTFIYYFTPKSIAKTLFVNGEGIVFWAHLKQEGLSDLFKSSKAKELLFSNDPTHLGWIMQNPTLFNSMEIFSRIDMTDSSKLLDATLENYAEVIDKLRTQVASGAITDVELINFLDKVGRISDKLQNSKLLKYATFLRNFYEKYNVKALISKGVQFVLLKFMGKVAYKKFLTTTMGKLLIGKLALRTVLRGAIHAAMQALSTVFSAGTLNLIVLVLTEIAIVIAEKLLKPVVKTLVFIVWGIVLFIAVLMFGGLSGINDLVTGSSSGKKFETVSYVPPTDVDLCAVGDIDEDDEYPDPPDDDDGDDNGERPEPPPAVSGVVCPLLDSSSNVAVNIHCSQGPSHGQKGSHKAKNAIDITTPTLYWAAPTDLEIRRADMVYRNSNGQKCGGIVHAYSAEHGVTYVLIHVVPYVSLNQTVAKGESVAKKAFESDGNIEFIKADGSCATGAHFHLEVSGSSARADDYYRKTLCCDVKQCWPYDATQTPGGVGPGCGSGGPGEVCGDFKTFSGVGFKDLGDKVIGIGSSKPDITGNTQVDENIRKIAERRGYKPRNDGGSLKGGVNAAYGNMAEAIKTEKGLSLVFASGHRNFADQRTIFLGRLNIAAPDCKSNISSTCDSKINEILQLYSIPGYSKHHTGYAIDLKCGSGDYQDFRNSGCYAWLSADNYCNAKKFGFIPSYPSDAGNQGPDPEEWEYIYVGIGNVKK